MADERFVLRKFETGDFTPDSPVTVEAWKGIFDGYREQLGEELFNWFYDGWQARKYGEFCEAMHKNAENNAALTIVDTADGSVAAMGSYRAQGETGVFCSNAVRPDLRGRGIGTMLYSGMLQSMREQGLKYAQTTTGLDEAHAAARRTYERTGFGYPLPHINCFRKNTDIHGAAEYALPDGIEIRRPAEEDVEKIAKISVEAWQPIWAAYRRILGELFGLLGNVENGKYNSTIHLMKNPDAFGYGVYCGGELAGFCGWSISRGPKGNYGIVSLNGISDAFRGRGLGSIMQKFIAQDMLKHDILYAKVQTGLDDGHAPARKMYERAGFCRGLPSVTYRMVL